MAFWLLDDEVSGAGTKLVHDYAEKRFVPLWADSKNYSKVEAEYCFEFIYNGAISILKRWYRNGCQGKSEEVKKIFCEMVSHTLKLLH